MVFTSSSTTITSGFANPIAAARNVDTSKAFVPREPLPATPSDRGEVAADRNVVQQSIEVTDEGEVALREFTEYERDTYKRVIKIMYTAALNEPENPEDEKPAKKEICVDFCCQACTCNFSSMAQPFRRRRSDAPPAISKVDDLTSPILRRGRAKGWDMHDEIILPLMNDAIREILVSIELIIVIIALAFSAATFSLGNDRAFNILHLALTIIGSVLAVVDAIFSLSGCKICRACCCHKKANEEENREVDDIAKESITSAETGQSRNQQVGGCRKCLNATKTKLDFVRMILTEVILFPLLICDIFELVLGEPYKFKNAANGFSFVLFVISSLSLFFYVYVMRLAILAGTIYYTQKARKPGTANGTQSQNKGEISKSAFYFQAYFFYHVMMQMVAQILMIVAIGAKIRYDNRHLFGSKDNDDMIMDEDDMNTDEENMNTDEGIRISNYLWYMLVSGYVLPVAGFFTFFIVTYYWVQEFPIGLCIDLLSLLQMPGMDNVLNYKESSKELSNKMDKIMGYLHYSDLKTKFNGLHQKRWLDDKFLYPFKSPVIVILCMSYTTLQLAFVICAAVVETDSGDLKIQPLNGGPWVGIYVVAVFIGSIANMYVFTVAFFWTGVIIFILIVIAMTIVLIGLICLICCLASSSSNNNDKYRR